jgi:hypothetical protein
LEDEKMTAQMMLLASASALAVAAGATPAAAAADCRSLASLALPDTRISMAEPVAAGAFSPPLPSWAKGLGMRQPKPVPAAFCRVTGDILSAPDSDIKFEVWLPASGWTGRYESVGNGGFAGGIRYDSMVNPLLGGSVVASTDDGHTAPAIGPGSASWALGHPQKVKDYGYRAVHLTAETAKAITKAFYGEAPTHSYFVGCSKGGQEALMEAQRYPSDFDGIVGGANANRWVDLFSSFSWTQNMTLANRDGYLSPADMDKIAAAVAAACDAQDGVKDGLISDPLRCRVDMSKIGLSPAKLRSYQAIHDGPHDRAGNPIYAGMPFGGELGWKDTVSGASFEDAPVNAQMSMYGDGFFANFVHQDAGWTFRGFDIDAERANAGKLLGADMNADDPRMSAFKTRGGKFIQFAGWADTIVTPMGTIDFYKQVVAAQATAAEDPAALERTQGFYRLFLAPGVGHCGGGPGPNNFGQAGGNGEASHDMVVAMENWVEKGVAPTRIVATKFVGDQPAKGVAMTRPLCPYPQVARYRGSGDTNDAANFECEPK